MDQLPINVGDDDYDPLFAYGFGLKYPLPVEIDILPGSETNPVNPGSRAVVPVALLTTDEFDASSADPATLAFGPARAPIAHKDGHLEDVDGLSEVPLGDVHQRLESGIRNGDPLSLFDPGYVFPNLVLLQGGEPHHGAS